MGTNIRPTVSSKNPYYISKHRRYELVHFCMQLPEWERSYRFLENEIKYGIDTRKVKVDESDLPDYTARRATQLAFFSERIDMVRQTAYETDPLLAPYILRGITEARSYDWLWQNANIPCSKDLYYKTYRQFLYNLSLKRQ